jgi:hypothetical protein
MRRLVQNKMSRRYVTAGDAWTDDIYEALDFEESIRALQFCRKHPELKLQVVLDFQDKKYNLKISIDRLRSEDPAGYVR